VDRTGARLGKGGGFADLEFAVASAAGLITDRTVVATTVHPLQVVADGRIPVTAHDVPVDLIVTPEEVIRCPRSGARPAAVRWEALTEEKVEAIPLLRRLREIGAG
jgi:5-formyltetrahydrofolate cyclo-ligase